MPGGIPVGGLMQRSRTTWREIRSISHEGFRCKRDDQGDRYWLTNLTGVYSNEATLVTMRIPREALSDSSHYTCYLGVMLTERTLVPAIAKVKLESVIREIQTIQY